MVARGTGATQAIIWDESDDVFAFVQTNDGANVIGNVNISSYASIRAGGATFAQVKITTGALSNYVLTSDSTGLASWTSSATVLANASGITGSGTANYVPYYLSSNRLSSTSSVYISTNENVGVNTITPSDKFEVKMTESAGPRYFKTQAADGVSLYRADGGAWAMSYGFATGSVGANNAGGFGGYGGGDLFTYYWIGQSHTSPIMTLLNSNSSVGIGTTTPSAKLHITQTGAGNALLVEDSTSPDSTPFVIDTNGNVGIGITTPSVKLEILGTSSNSLAIISGSTSVNMVRITQTGTGNAFVVEDDANTDASHFFVDASGSVGIGLTAGSAKLHISASQSNPLIIASGSTTADLVRITQTGAGNSFVVEDATNPDSSLFFIDTTGNVGIGLTQTTYKHDVNGTSRVYGRGLTGSTLFTVQGTTGELFTIVDSLTGSLFSVNDISGLPIMEVFSDSTTLIGDYLAPSLYTTKKVAVGTGATAIYSIATASYDSAYYDYNVKNGTNSRAGNIMAVWNGPGVKWTEIYTTDIGNTTGITFSVTLSSGYATLNAHTVATGWTVKTIIRSI